VLLQNGLFLLDETALSGPSSDIPSPSCNGRRPESVLTGC
jgi:hypothetical protein